MHLNRIIAYLTAIVLLGASGVPAAAPDAPQSPVITIKAAKHQGFIRIVLGGDDALLQGITAIMTEGKDIRITTKTPKDRPAPIFRAEKGPLKQDTPLEIFKSVNAIGKSDGFLVTVPGLEDIKVSRLANPSRFVIDARITAAPAGEASQAPAIKAPVDQVPFRSLLFDAGHGGYDFGMKGAHFTEKEIALSFAKDLAALFAKGGREALLTRKSDQILTLTERLQAVLRRPPEVFISIHVAMTREPRIYSPAEPVDGSPLSLRPYDQKRREQSRAIAQSVAAAFQKEFGFAIGVEQLPLELISRSPVPALLIELPNPDLMSYDKKTRERLLLVIIKGLAASPRDERLPLPPATPVPPKPERASPPAPAPKPEKTVSSAGKPDKTPPPSPKPEKPASPAAPDTTPPVDAREKGGNP